MKQIVKYIYAMLLLVGCTKDLDLYPLDTVSDATFWKSADDFKLAANKLYESLSFQSITEDLESDIAFSQPNGVSNGSYLPSETDNNWSEPYVYIRRCNTIMEKAEQSGLNSDSEVLKYVAEGKFFRAWSYWNLYKRYGGVPLITDVLGIDSEQLYAPRATEDETVDFMLKDLNEAIVDLPSKSSMGAKDTGRITKGAANALKARIALYKGTWDKYHNGGDTKNYLDIAMQAANAVISSGEYSLYTDSGSESYRYLFIEQGDDSSEGILDNRYEVNVRGQNFPDYIVSSQGYLATKTLADMYLCSDGLPITQSTLFEGYDTRVSEFQERDPRMSMSLVIPGTPLVWSLVPTPTPSWPFTPQRNGNTGYITNKYRSEDDFGNRTQANLFGYDYHLIRYAEVLLIYAEAVFEKNGSIADEDLDKTINLIRDRVNMVPLKNAFVTSNGLDMKEEIRRERTIELALEGYRYDDLRRWKTAEIELPKPIKGIKITGTQWGTEEIPDVSNYYLRPEIQAKADADGYLVAEPMSLRTFDPTKHYLKPIPTRQIQISNGLLKQNPNW